MTIKVLLINEVGASFIDIENTNEGFNNALGWDDAWNTPTIYVNEKPFIVVCSDLGKVRHEPVSAIGYLNIFGDDKQPLREPFIVGNIIVTKFDGTDDFVSLNENDIQTLKLNLLTLPKRISKDFYQTMLIIE